jgi:hypothetical protein
MIYVGTAALGCPAGACPERAIATEGKPAAALHNFIRATSQLNAGTILGPGFFLRSSIHGNRLVIAAPHNFVIPTGVGAPATPEWRNLLFACHAPDGGWLTFAPS